MHKNAGAGEKLVAILNAPNVKRKVHGNGGGSKDGEEEDPEFLPGGDDATYYGPVNEKEGTTYKVKFTPVSSYAAAASQRHQRKS